VGPDLDAFEKEFADQVGVPHAAALSSGTAALDLAFRLLGVGPGDEVLVPSLTFVASIAPAVHLGATPVFVDVDPSTWTLDPGLLRAELEEAADAGRLPKCVVTVDLYGQPCDHDAILDACNEHGVPVIEDAAEALGSTWKDEPLGRFGRVGVFSFNGNKIVTTSGGGMLVSDDGDLVERARHLATQAREPAPHYEHATLGFNHRLSNVLAALGRSQLQQLDTRVAARRANFDAYAEGLGDLPGVRFMPEIEGGRSNRWLTCLTIDADAFGADREAVREALAAEDIEARPVWKPMHLQPVFSGARARGGDVSARLFETGLCLPSGSSLEEEDLDRVVRIVRGVAAGGGGS
jgi:pyridoxal phosphate-dependent aminotransferase EpsN